MAGNSPRPGATRKPGTKKGQVVGSGGQQRKKLEGRGPTPRAEDRPGHVAYRRARSEQKRSGGRRSGRDGGRGGRRPGAESVAGRNAVLEALQAGIPASVLHVQQHLDSDDRVREALRIAVGRETPLVETTRGDLDRLSGGAVHQGLVLQVPAYAYADPTRLMARARDAGEQPLIVALDGITDPRNLGAIVRSAAAFGAHGVVIPERRAAGMTASAWKASAGAAARVPVARATNLVRWLTAAQQEGATVLGLAAEGPLRLPDLSPADATGPLVIVVGSEGKGLGHLVSQTCDRLLAIPIDAATESLNAGVAAGIALYGVATARR